MNRIFDGLNDKQREAVTSTEGYVRVIAGAGSGKTRALTRRYAYIASELGISPSGILCLTFTNKAADEMKKRVRQLLGDDTDTSMISTIHSFCATILRQDISKVFYPESFIILDAADQKKILEEIYEEMGLKLDTASFKKILDRMEIYKGTLDYLDYISEPSRDIRSIVPSDTTEAVILRYIEKQKKYYALDFADLLNFVMYIFAKYPEVLEKWQKRICYVQVDEFQDVDAQEYEFIKQISGGYKNLFVVGDPDQNIYEWRGAEMRIIINFDKELTPCKTIVMSDNYRSTPEIVAAANSLIEKNRVRVKKNLRAVNPSLGQVEYYHGRSDADEIERIVSKIKKNREEGAAYSDNAVLYRSTYVSRFIEQGFIERGIPYRVMGGVGFYERSEIKDVLAYMRLICSGDDLSFKRIINMPRRKIGKKKMKYLEECSEKENISLLEALRRHRADPVFSGSGAADFMETVDRLISERDGIQVSELLQKILKDTGYEYYIRQNGDMDRLDNVTELLQSIYNTERDYGEDMDLSAFLQNAALMHPSDDADEHDRVKIMTVHVAKGLEFDHVFVAGMSETVFPAQRALATRGKDALEEERRLAFVALTRAKKSLTISDSEGMNAYGGAKSPSRFITDIGEDNLLMTGYKYNRSYSASGKFSEAKDRSSFLVGNDVYHRVFGKGRVESVDGDAHVVYVRFGCSVRPIDSSYQGIVKLG